MSGFGLQQGFQVSGMPSTQLNGSISAPPSSSSGGSFNPFKLAAGFVSGLAQSGLNYLFARKLQREQNEYNEEQTAKMNNYNSFNAVKNRLIAAGVPEKAAIQAIAGSPSLGQQSAAPVASPYVGSMPGTDLIQGIGSSYANQLVDAQTQNTNAQSHATLTDTSLRIKESSANVQKTLAEVRNINEHTLTSELMRMWRSQEQPYRLKLMESEYIQANLVVGAWNTLTEPEKRQTFKSLGKTMYNNASYDSQMSRYKSRNAHLENQVMVAAFKAAITKSNYDSDEYKQKGRVLLSVYDAIEAGAKRDAAAYGWDREIIENQRENKGIIFNTYELDLSNQYDASVVLNRRLRFLNDNSWLIEAQTATDYGASTLNTVLKVGMNVFPAGKAAKLLHF